MVSTDLAGAAGTIVLLVALGLLLRIAPRLLAARRNAAAGDAALSLLGQLALDNRRRLLLVGYGEHRVLVLAGGAGADTMLFCPPGAVPTEIRS